MAERDLLPKDRYEVTAAATYALSRFMDEAENVVGATDDYPMFHLELLSSPTGDDIKFSIGWSPLSEASTRDRECLSNHGVLLRIPNVLHDEEKLIVDHNGDDFVFLGVDFDRLRRAILSR